MTDLPDPDRNAKGHFITGNAVGGAWKPGQSGNPKGSSAGRRRLPPIKASAKARVGDQFLDKLAEAFEKYGEDAIKQVAEKQPAEFLRLCAKFAPTPEKVTRTVIDEVKAMSPEQIEKEIMRLRKKQSDEAVEIVEHEGT